MICSGPIGAAPLGAGTTAESLEPPEPPEPIIRSADGYTSTLFGTPIGALVGAFCTVQGFSPTSLGIPTALHYNPAQGFTSTSFGTPTSPQLVTAAVQPWLTTHFGIPSATQGAVNVEVPLSFACSAFGFIASAFGTHSSAYLQIGAVTGTAFGAVGNPTGTTQQVQASGFVSGAAGIARTVIRLRHTGTRLTEVGTPMAARILFGTAAAPATRFGTARTIQGVEHLTSSVGPARFGQPAARRAGDHAASSLTPRANFGRAAGFSRFNYPATGFIGTNVGTPACHERHRVAHIAPATAFGSPLLKRAPTC